MWVTGIFCAALTAVGPSVIRPVPSVGRIGSARRKDSSVKLRQSTVTASVVGLAVGLAAVPGCSSGGSSQAPTSRASAGSSSSSGGSNASPAPQATESNPAGDIPDTQAFVAYTAPGNVFTVQVPEGWARSGSGQSVTFSDKYNSIEMTSRPTTTAPSIASATGQELPAIRAAARGFSNPGVRTVRRAAGPAILITYRADSQPNAVTGKV